MARKSVKTIFKPSTKGKFSRPDGAGNFDNMDDYNIVQSVSIRQGTIQHTPANDKDIANKKYVDDNIGAVEGTAVLSTGEGGGTKFLREDGDGTCSWQAAAGGGDVTAAANMVDNTIIKGDGGAKGVQDSGITVDDSDNVANMGTLGCGVITTAANGTSANWKTGYDHSQDNTQAHTDYLLNNDNDTSTGIITAASFVASGSSGTSAEWDTAYTHSQDNTQAHSDYLLNSAADVGVGLTLTGDNSSADTAYVPMVLYNTDATPPAASGFPIGTLYVQYTA